MLSFSFRSSATTFLIFRRLSVKNNYTLWKNTNFNISYCMLRRIQSLLNPKPRDFAILYHRAKSSEGKPKNDNLSVTLKIFPYASNLDTLKMLLYDGCQGDDIFRFGYAGTSKLFMNTMIRLNRLVDSFSSLKYEEISEETLQSLGDQFEECLENSELNDFDVNYSNDVLTVSLNSFGTYVINKQSPNKQVWLSSPISGPKRYDFINGTWIYKHDGKSLHQLLSDEMSDVLKKDISFLSCSYSSKESN